MEPLRFSLRFDLSMLPLEKAIWIALIFFAFKNKLWRPKLALMGRKPMGHSLEKHFQEGVSTQRSLHYAPPDFLSISVALAKFLRPSLRRAAYVVVVSAA